MRGLGAWEWVEEGFDGSVSRVAPSALETLTGVGEDRYAASPGFRRLMYWQTVYWMIWGAVYIAVTSVVAWVAG